MRTITKIEHTMPVIMARKKVAAYARISMESERMNHSLSAQISYIWICRTKSEQGIKFCTAKNIPEVTLKKVCTEVLGLDEFDENMFSEKVDEITVIGDDMLEFHLTDGTIIHRQWQSTARTDSWTEERRKQWGELHKNKSTNPNRARYSEFTGFIKCGICGGNYRVQSVTYADGTKERTWRCCNSCGNMAIKESVLKPIVCDALNIDTFSETLMDKLIEKSVISNGTVKLEFKDGRSVCREYRNEVKGCTHTEEYKRYMSGLMKEKWRQRKESEK